MMELLSIQYHALRQKHFFVSETPARIYTPRKMYPLSERLVRCLWYDQRFNEKELKTVDGVPIKVYSQGEWNMSGGPDFGDALVQIGDAQPVRGAVEIHVRTSDWKRHGHQKDKGFRDVALNVAMWHDDFESSAFNDLDQPIPHVEICDILDSDLQELSLSIDMENYPFSSRSRVGRCNRVIQNRQHTLEYFLRIAGQERLFSKARRLQNELERSAFEDVLYNALMEAMGYRPNKKPFRILAARLPAASIREVELKAPAEDMAEIYNALFFGASGLFSNIQIDFTDEVTRDYCERLAGHWRNWSGLVQGPIMNKKDWRIRGVRPANFPLRRMAAMSELLSRLSLNGINNMLMEFGNSVKSASGEKEVRRMLDGVCSVLEQPPHGYWAGRMAPAGTILDSVPSLIGKTTALTIVINIFFPLLLCVARESDDEKLRDAVMRTYGFTPSLDSHQITRLMRYRVWGDVKGGAALLRKEIYQQGLLQVFFDYCDENVRDCTRCPLPEILNKGQELPMECN